MSKRARLLCLLVLLPALVPGPAASVAEAAKRGARVETPGYRYLFYRGEDAGVPVAESWSETVILDAEETIERHLRFRLTLPDTLAADDAIPMTVVDEAMGDLCETDAGEILVEEQVSGYGHLGLPVLCSWLPPADQRRAGTVVEGHVVVHRPRLARLDHRFAMLLFVQPPGIRAASLEFAVEHGPGQRPSVRPHGWSVEMNVKELGRGRYRTFFQLESVARLPLRSGVGTLSGRVPAVAVTSAETWDNLALDHKAFFDAAARARGEAIPLAGRVLAQPDVLASVLEAVRLALDTIELDPSGGRGGGWQLPQRASETAAFGAGTAADRAALLVAMLRAAEIRAEFVLAGRSAHRVSPGEPPLALLNQTLVFLPDVRLEEGGGPLFIDPSRSAAWLGALDEALIGRDALMLGDRGARWLRLPADPPRQSWTLNARENREALFDLQIAGVLGGAAAARVREWEAAGRPDDRLPAQDLAWLGGGWRQTLELRIEEEAGGRLAVSAEGQVPVDVALVDRHLPVPWLPEPARPDASGDSWPFARDTLPLEVDLLESWTFRSRHSGGAAPEGRKLTPFWEVDSLGSWSGPLFSRRTRVRFEGAVLAPAAAMEVERFVDFCDRVLGGVTAP